MIKLWFYCLSVWMAAPVAIIIGETMKEHLLLWPALSGAAILLERGQICVNRKGFGLRLHVHDAVPDHSGLVR